jgi:hypothetical protein
MFHASSGAGYESSSAADRESPRLLYDLRRELGYDESAAGLESPRVGHDQSAAGCESMLKKSQRRKLRGADFVASPSPRVGHDQSAAGRESPPLGYAEAGITASLGFGRETYR